MNIPPRINGDLTETQVNKLWEGAQSDTCRGPQARFHSVDATLCLAEAAELPRAGSLTDAAISLGQQQEEGLRPPPWRASEESQNHRSGGGSLPSALLTSGGSLSGGYPGAPLMPEHPPCDDHRYGVVPPGAGSRSWSNGSYVSRWSPKNGTLGSDLSPRLNSEIGIGNPAPVGVRGNGSQEAENCRD